MTAANPTHVTTVAERLGLKIPGEVIEYLKKYAGIVGPILLRELPLVFLHLRAWPQVLADIIAAVANQPDPTPEAK